MARYKLAYLHPAETDILGIVRFHAEQVGPASAKEVYRVAFRTFRCWGRSTLTRSWRR